MCFYDGKTEAISSGIPDTASFCSRNELRDTLDVTEG